jgi:hypothetical protein
MKWQTVIKFDEKIKDKIEKIASDIAEIDDTFDFIIKKNYLIIFSKDKDTAIRRGDWFFHKVSKRVGQKLHFNVFGD